VFLLPIIGMEKQVNPFINSVLQSLFSIEPFVLYFIQKKYKIQGKYQEVCDLFSNTLSQFQNSKETQNCLSFNFYLE